MKYLFYIIVFFICREDPVSGQNNIGIYADLKSNDSLQNLVTIFTRELKKSSPVNFIVQNTSSYNGKGIYICLANTSQKVKPSTKLIKSGVEAFSVDANDQSVQI